MDTVLYFSMWNTSSDDGGAVALDWESPGAGIDSEIKHYLRECLYKLVNNQVEALEFKANDKSKALNISLKNLKLKNNLLIAGIIRDGEVIIPSGDSCIQTNDSVIIVTTNPYLDELDDILE